MKWENELTSMLGIQYPVVQAPMLGVTTPEMVAAISDAGGLGSLPVGGLSPERTIELIARTKALTKAPFAVNLFSNSLPEKTDQTVFEDMQDLLQSICDNHDLVYQRQVFDPKSFPAYTDQIEGILEQDIPVVSFTFGALDEKTIKAFKARGTILIGTATSLEEAAVLDSIGIDIIVAQGIEAGGHRGTFLENQPLPMIRLMPLLSEITSTIYKPVLAAGGINNGRTIKNALLARAAGAQIGTAFIASEESAAIPAYKQIFNNTTIPDTVLTKTFSGRWARGFRNTFITEVEKAGLAIPDFPIQVALTSPIRLQAQRQSNIEFTTLWAGQNAIRSSNGPVAKIFHDLIKQTEEVG